MKACFENIFKGDIDALMDSITGSLNRGEKRFIITANPEIYMQAEKSREVERLLCGDNTAVSYTHLEFIGASFADIAV